MEVHKIYFDMDSVLADFDRGVQELGQLPFSPRDIKTDAQDDEMWAAIRTVDHFYFRLEPMPGAIEMFREIYEKYGDRCEILTGIPKPKRGILTAGQDKIEWVRKLLSPDIVVNVVFAEEKGKFCTGPECVLIDDLERNIASWESCGGTGILHKSAEETLKLLREKGIL